MCRFRAIARSTFLSLSLCLAPSARAVTHTTCAALAKAIMADQSDGARFAVTGQVLQVHRTTSMTEVALKDDTGAVTIKSSRKSKATAGDTVRAVGVIRTGYNNIPEASFWELVTILPGTSPSPRSVSADDILRGRCDWELVEIEGVIRNAFPSEFSQDWLIVELNSQGTAIHASTPRTDKALSRLRQSIEATVRLVGICTPRDGSKRSQAGRILHFPGPESVRILVPSPTDPFVAPSLDQLDGQSPSIIATLGRHCARGLVLAVWNGRRALLHSERGRILKVDFPEGAVPTVGDFVEVTGLPESDLQHINLTAAKFRAAPPFPFKAPNVEDFPVLSTFEKDGLSKVADLHGKPVRINGILRSKPAGDSPSRLFHLDIGDRLIPFDAGAAMATMDVVQPGSRLELIGICVLDLENWRPRMTFPQINGCTVVLRSPQDVSILSTPSWWTPGRLLAVIGTLLAVLLGILVWNAALRKAATRKGRELLREQLGHVKAELKTAERTRLAVELHDTLAQNLTGVSMELEAANELRGNAPPEMLSHIGIAAKALKSCRDELRNCLWDLRSQALEENDMNKAVLKTLQPVVNDSRLIVRFNVPRARLSDNTTHALLRVIRELVVNAIRHGNATTVKVAGTIDGEKLLCSVTDNGVGFDPETVPGVLQGHFGLQGIQERIDEIGGTLDIESSPSKGAKATITIPVPRET